MKKILWSLIMSTLLISSASAYTKHNLESANFLAEKWIINDNSLSAANYNLDMNITRREMLKVLMNVSWKTVTDSCTGEFSDLQSSDWGCKYAEAALQNDYIAANNTFRPDDNVTQIEALKMIMQAAGIERDANVDWRAWYVSKAYSDDLLDENFIQYDIPAIRGWIFSTAAKSYSDFDYTAPTSETDVDPEIEALFKELLEL